MSGNIFMFWIYSIVGKTQYVAPRRRIWKDSIVNRMPSFKSFPVFCISKSVVKLCKSFIPPQWIETFVWIKTAALFILTVDLEHSIQTSLVFFINILANCILINMSCKQVRVEKNVLLHSKCIYNANVPDYLLKSLFSCYLNCKYCWKYLLKSVSFLSSMISISSTISSTNLGEYLPRSVTSLSISTSIPADFMNFST